MENVRARVHIRGRVQGVFFRASTRDAASVLGVRGWVRNTFEGDVEAVFEGDRDNVERLGPVAAPLARLQKKYRWHMLLKGVKPGPLHGLSRAMMEKAGRIPSRGRVKVIVDVDPIDML